MKEKIASPIATGGGGTFFEQHVDALLLGLLLVSGIPPVLKSCQVRELHLQARHLGWSTDDSLITCASGAGERSRLLAQVKRDLAIGDKNEECCKTFAGFWRDFKNESFDPARDRLALIVQLGSRTLLSTFNSLLDCARAALNSTDFASRIPHLSKAAQTQADAIKRIVQSTNGDPIHESDFWQFLQTLHVISFDLATASSQTQALLQTMLAESYAGEGDAVAVSRATWRELLELAATGMPRAESFNRDKLPKPLLEKYKPLTLGGPLARLAEHGQSVLGVIRTSVAGVVIPREALISRTLELLDAHQVTVLTGPAGFGKSALAKNALASLGNHYFCLAFRAVEFARPHIDQVLQQAQIGIGQHRLLAVLAAQGRKVVLVDGVERLLESTTRDAFVDLLSLVKQDPGLQLLLTCRDYSLDAVRDSLLRPLELEAAYVNIPALTDDELDAVAQKQTSLTNAMSSRRFRRLLSSPYLLNLATQIDWSMPRSLPTDERSLRVQLWAQIVRRDDYTHEAMPRRREDVFLSLAVNRARLLKPYVDCRSLDAQALDNLRKDGLVVPSEETPDLCAPSHDVLEDWAVVKWLERQFALCERDPKSFAQCVGEYPAVRRSYRIWLGELLECDAAVADAFVTLVLHSGGLRAHFRDDTLVATLRSSSAADFLRRQRRIFVSGGELVRIVHLLRVACKEVYRLPGIGDTRYLPLVPTNASAWAGVIELAADEVENFHPIQKGIAIGLLSDWADLVGLDLPDPPGFQAAGALVFALLRHFEAEGPRDSVKECLEVICKIPRANMVEFRKLLTRCSSSEDADSAASELTTVLLTGLRGAYACRDCPNDIAQLLLSKYRSLPATSTEVPHRWFQGFEHEEPFGFTYRAHKDFFPASAIRGPFLQLLRFHPALGLQLVVELVNHATTCVRERTVKEPIESIAISIPGESPIRQWGDEQLWCLYRGGRGPYILQTALMALERWLLDLAEDPTQSDVEQLLLNILRQSNNLALTAVVASVCVAHPTRFVRAALTLLSARKLIQLDLGRSAQDQLGRLGFIEPAPYQKYENHLFASERTESGKRPHRRHSLEQLAQELQLGPTREQVWKALDIHWTACPPLEERTAQDRFWCLALYRMDIRRYRPVVADGIEHTTDRPSESQLGASIAYYAPGELEEDIQAMVSESAIARMKMERHLALQNWGHSAWARSENAEAYEATWRAKLDAAMQLEHEEVPWHLRGGPGFVAAVCARDYWDEMDSPAQSWCLQRLIHEIESHSDSADGLTTMARGVAGPDRYAAVALAAVLGRSDPAHADPSQLRVLGKALTHAVAEVADYAAVGIGEYLKGAWQSVSLRCAGALAVQARLGQEALRTAQPFREDTILPDVTSVVRDLIERGELDIDQELNILSLRTRLGSLGARRILWVLRHHSDSRSALIFHQRAVEFLADSWSSAGERGRRKERDYGLEGELSRGVAKFALSVRQQDALTLCEPLLAVLEESPDEVAQFVKSLILAEDVETGETPFWSLWQAFANRLSNASWSQTKSIAVGTSTINTTLLDSHRGARILLDRLFLEVEWKPGIRHWARLNDQSERLDDLFRVLPRSRTVLHAYSRYLATVGERSLERGLLLIAERYGSDAVFSLSTFVSSASVSHLVQLLDDAIYRDARRLKENQPLKMAVLSLLDALVAAGSSRAFRLRDDFMTPLPAA